MDGRFGSVHGRGVYQVHLVSLYHLYRRLSNPVGTNTARMFKSKLSATNNPGKLQILNSRFNLDRNLSGYSFVEFGNAFAAHKYLHQLNGQTIPGTNKTFNLNWASGGTGSSNLP